MIASLCRVNSRNFLKNSRLFGQPVPGLSTPNTRQPWQYGIQLLHHPPASPFSSTVRRLSNNVTSDERDRRRRQLPALMEFPEILWPNLLKSIKNWILINFIIRPYFDNEFTIQEFAQGSKHALQLISSCISAGTDIDNTLKGMVTDEAIAEIKKSISEMSMKQRHEIECHKEDIAFGFPFQVGIMFDESDSDVQRRWVEITMVYHVLRGQKELIRERGAIPLHAGTDPEYRDKYTVCNYRFIKEFTQNQQSDWVVNKVNHFKPVDLAERPE